MNDYATCVEVSETNGVLPNVAYDAQFNIGSSQGNSAGINPDRFERATILASQFKFYRATRVEYTYQPLFNTYQAGSGASVPYLYQVMNRSGEQQPTAAGAPTLSRFQLQRMGATPEKLIKTLFKSYKPNTLVGTASSHNLATGGSLGKTSAFINWSFTPKYDEWLSTEILKGSYPLASGSPNINAAIVQPPNYYGHWFYIHQDDVNGEVPVCDILVKVHFEFKDPRSLDDTRTSAMSDIARQFPTAE